MKPSSHASQNKTSPTTTKLERAISDSRKPRDERNTALAPTTSDVETQLAVPAGAESMISTFVQEDWGDDIGDGGAVAAPILITLKTNDVIHGHLLGNGPDAEFPDDNTGGTDKVRTWILRSLTSGVRVSILGATQLNRELEEWIGCDVRIARGPEVKRAGKPGYYTAYAVKGYPETRDAPMRALRAAQEG